MGVNSNRTRGGRSSAGGKLFNRQGAATQKALWSDTANELVLKALHAMTQADGILSIGCAMGGSGLVVTTWVDGVKEQQYCGDAETLEDALDTLLEYWRAKAPVPLRAPEAAPDRRDRRAGGTTP